MGCLSSPGGGRRQQSRGGGEALCRPSAARLGWDRAEAFPTGSAPGIGLGNPWGHGPCAGVGWEPGPAGCRATRSQELTGAGSSLQGRKGKAGTGLVSAAQGCTKGFHCKEKPPEPLQEESSDKPKAKPVAEFIIQGPKSAEKMQRERPSSDEPRQLLPIKVSRSLEQALEKLSLSPNAKVPEGGCTGSCESAAEGLASPERGLWEGWGQAVRVPEPSCAVLAGEVAVQVRAGTTCKNAACKAVYQGAESNAEVCTFHPGVPVFHEGMKYWSCCGVRTTDFSAFLEQPGCSTGRHCWTGKADKKAVSCRQDWHQTSSQVVVTIYAKNPLPALSSVKANRTVLEVHVIFEGNKIFQAELDLWGGRRGVVVRDLPENPRRIPGSRGAQGWRKPLAENAVRKRSRSLRQVISGGTGLCFWVKNADYKVRSCWRWRCGKNLSSHQLYHQCLPRRVHPYCV
uniref:Integrin subunit beta 1 binding protein 2 n=1 Tax=Anser cygnoides TaxID=8845 RepID=A0A8B9IEN7_ANSCY